MQRLEAIFYYRGTKLHMIYYRIKEVQGLTESIYIWIRIYRWLENVFTYSIALYIDL